MAWPGKIETDSILFKEKHKHLSKCRTGCLKCLQHKHLKFEINESIHRSIYRQPKCIRYGIILEI